MNTEPDGLRVRRAAAADAVAVVDMLAGLARFERASSAPRFDTTAFARDALGPTPRIAIFVAEIGAQLVGCVTVFMTYSTWEGGPAAHIGDLWVESAHRAAGAGRLLVEAATTWATDNGAQRIDVYVLADNSARSFYEKLAFAHQPQWLLYRRSAANTPLHADVT